MHDMNKCMDLSEYIRLTDLINADKRLSMEQRNFFKLIATRFIVFKYEKLADLYASSDVIMQEWLEKLKCVIVDNDSAIKNGYFDYFDNYNKLLKGIVENE